ncbi:hypothetical protein WG66_005882 [Moniliophthora roreri]|nr:hypothetical protein WG66_005882 [Moniliophthora roreri]
MTWDFGKRQIRWDLDFWIYRIRKPAFAPDRHHSTLDVCAVAGFSIYKSRSGFVFSVYVGLRLDDLSSMGSLPPDVSRSLRRALPQPVPIPTLISRSVSTALNNDA